jgi:hypothetical protein
MYSVTGVPLIYEPLRFPVFLSVVLDKLLAYIQTELFGGNMKKQVTDQIPKLSHIPIILSVLLIVGCATRTITAPDLLHPVSMSPNVGVNPNQKYQEVAKFSGWGFGEIKEKGTNDIQEQMSEVLKGSKRKAIKDMEIHVEDSAFILLLTRGGAFRVGAEGSVIEIQ